MSQDEQNLDQPKRLEITVDRDSSTPLHMQVSEPITEMITSASWLRDSSSKMKSLSQTACPYRAPP